MPRGKIGKQQRNARRLAGRGQMVACNLTKTEKQHIDQVVECMITKYNMDFNKLPAWMQAGEKSLIIQYIKENYEEEKKK